MIQKHILLVEDEEHLLSTIQLNLELENFLVSTAINGREAIDIFNTKSFDLIILDVMLPEINGYDVCKTIRNEDTNIPILFLSAKNASDERIKGLKLGADDYLPKPFNLEELLLRIKILLKRGETSSTSPQLQTYSFGDNNVNFSTFEINGVNQATKTLSKREIALLKLLINRKGEVIAREEILDEVWGINNYPSARTIDNYILAFRKYFEIDQRSPKHFHSIRGVGYKFTD